MTTHYDQIPSLEERVRASRLVVVGTVESVELLAQRGIGEVEEQQAIAHVAVDDVLRGATEASRIDVRFIARGGPGSAAQNHPFRSGQRVVLMLVPDVGRDARPNTWVSYFGAHYALSAGDTFSAGPGSTEAPRTRRVTLRTLREMIRAAAAAETAELRAWEKQEPELLERRRLPRTTELPEPEPGAGPAQARPAESQEVQAPRRATRRK